MMHVFNSQQSRRASHCLRAAESGFTLVEMIVAVFIFTVVMLIATGALMTVLDANRRAQANKAVMNNLHFALESMTREIRVGTNFNELSASPSDFQFVDKDGCTITYDLIDTDGDTIDEIVRSVNNQSPGCTKESSTDVPLTAPEVTIGTLGFYVFGEEAGSTGDTEQPHVIILVRGIAGQTVRTQVPFNLQTVVTQRFLDR